MFDSFDLKKAIQETVDNLNAIDQYAADSAAAESERLHKIDTAILETSKNTDKIQKGLEAEADARKLADAENMRYTKLWDRRNLTVALIGITIAVASLIVAILK